MSVPGIGPMISTAMVAAIGKGEAFERGRDFGAWLGLVPRQYSTGGRTDPRAHLQARQQVSAHAFHPGGEGHPDAAAELGALQLRRLAAEAQPRDCTRTSSLPRWPTSWPASPGACSDNGKPFDTHRHEVVAI